MPSVLPSQLYDLDPGNEKKVSSKRDLVLDTCPTLHKICPTAANL